MGGIAMMRSVRSRAVFLSLVATVFAAAPSSIADPSDAAKPAPAAVSASKPDEAVFTDGFETGDTSMWSNGTVGDACQTTLVMPTELAD